MALASGTERLEREAMAVGTRFRLPPRQLPPQLRNVGAAALGFGVFFFAAGVARTLGLVGPELGGLFSVIWCLSGLAAAAFGLLLMKSRTVIELEDGRLVVREQVGALAVKRRFRLAELAQLRLEVLPLKRGAAPVPAQGAAADGGVTIVSAQVRGKGRQVLVFGYPEALMRELLVELTRAQPPGGGTP